MICLFMFKLKTYVFIQLRVVYGNKMNIALCYMSLTETKCKEHYLWYVMF